MIICENCQIRPICKIYDNIAPYKDIISLSECGAFNLTTKQNQQQVSEEKFEQADLKDRIQQIKEYTNAHKQEEELDYIPASKENVCELCGKEETDLLVCSECNKKICPDCSIEDLDGHIYCEDCYENLEASEL